MKELILANYGIYPESTSPLVGDINYSNLKYLVNDKSGNKYVLKIFPDKEELELAKEEYRILALMRGKLDFKTPCALPDQKGNIFSVLEGNEAILLKYIDGTFLSEVKQTESLVEDFGRSIASLHLALKDIESTPVKAKKHFWDLQYAYLNYDKAGYIDDPELKKHIDHYFGRYHRLVLPHLHKLRHSLIHGDLNDYNVLVSADRIEGFIDFGDICYSPLINELAVAAAYIMMNKEDPVRWATYLIRGFDEIVPLKPEELELLPDLITTRLCVSLCNCAEKRERQLANEYVLVSEDAAKELLLKWKEWGHNAILNSFYSSLGRNGADKQAMEKDILDKRNSIISKALSLSYTSPIYMESSLFQYMYDNTGNAYLDAYNNIPHVGHAHPRVAEAITKQAHSLNTNTRYLYDSLVNYGEELLEYFPKHLNKIFFVNSGSAASDLAIRLARNYTQKKHILVMDHGYHGNTSTGISISPYKFDGKGGPGVSQDISKLPLPGEYQGKLTGTEHAEGAKGIINQLLETGIAPAAFIAEPVSGCGGQVPLAPGYLKSLYPFLKENGIVTISDEVQVGFGRLGSWFWGYEMHAVVPDMVILGKPMGNGHPIGAVVTSTEIADTFSTGMEFFSSFGGNPVSCEAGKAVLDIIKEEGLQANAEEVGSYYLSSLRDLAKHHGIIGDVRGSGLFIGLEFTLEDGSPGTAIANKVKNKLKDNYILTGTDGPYDNVIKSKPPLCFSRNNVDRVVDTLNKILRELKTNPRSVT